MTLAITGASGQLGRRAAELLLEQVDPSQVVLLTRSVEKLADFAARGVDVRAADFGDAAGVQAALAGVERLLLVSTDAVGDRVVQQQAAIDAAKAAGVKHVIYTSAPKASLDNPAIATVEHAHTEAALKASGLAWTTLRNNLYSEMQVGSAAGAVARGKLFSNRGDGATAYVSREDCAAAAAGVLANGAAHENVDYEISGPEAFTDAQLAALFTEVSGRPVDVIQVDDAGLSAGMAAAGLPEFLIPVLVTFGAAAREGLLSEVSTAVADITGRPPVPLADVLAASRDALRQPAAH